MLIIEIAAKMSGFHCQFCKGSLMKVHYPKLYNMAHLLALNVLLLPKDLIIIFILRNCQGIKPVLCIHVPDSGIYIICIFYSRCIRTLVAMAT